MNIDKIYSDFITNVAPKIQEGLVITKEYFTDLFGRYVKYLIVSDIVNIISCIITSIICFYLIKFSIQKFIKTSEYSDERFGWGVMIFLSSLGMVISFVCFWISVDDLIKDIYIPEVRVIEEISSQINK